MATQSKIILVTGATGQQGGAVATALLIPAAFAKLNVVATTPYLAAIAREIGGDQVEDYPAFVRAAEVILQPVAGSVSGSDVARRAG